MHFSQTGLYHLSERLLHFLLRQRFVPGSITKLEESANGDQAMVRAGRKIGNGRNHSKPQPYAWSIFSKPCIILQV